jgi:hypothetical protein
MALNIFATSTLSKIIAGGQPKAHGALRKLFFGNAETHDTEMIEVHYNYGNRKMAPFVHELQNGKTVQGSGYQSTLLKAPYIAPNLLTKAGDMLKRGSGEQIGGSKSPQQRAAEKLGKDLGTLNNMCDRREEWMVSQLVSTGQFIAKFDGGEQLYDFWPSNAAEKPAKTSSWADADACDPLKDLGDGRKNIVRKSGLTADIAIMGDTAFERFKNSKKVQAELDNKGFNVGNFNPSIKEDGLVFRGFFPTIGEVYTYDEWYYDDATKEEKPMIPLNAVIIASKSAPCTMNYGVVTIADVKADDIQFFETERHPHSRVTESPKGRIVQIDSRPLPVIHEIGAFYVLTV